MKKAIIIILVLLFAINTCGIAFASDNGEEIRFLDIPWGSTIEEFKDSLVKQGYINKTKINIDEWIKKHEDDQSYWGAYCLEDEKYGATTKWADSNNKNVLYRYHFNKVKKKIGGYPVTDIMADFIYDSGIFKCAAVFVNLNIKKQKGVEKDLTDKLSSVYGNGISHENEILFGVGRYVTWTRNGTMVKMAYSDYDTSSPDEVTIIYGTTESEKWLADALANYVDPSKEDIPTADQTTDGL